MFTGQKIEENNNEIQTTQENIKQGWAAPC